MHCGDSGIHAALSEAFDQPVTLAEEGEISHFDVGPTHLVTMAALRWLQGRLLDSAIDERRFRPNILVDVPGTAQVEQQWFGRTLALGETVRLRVDDTTERCVMVTFGQTDLPKDPAVLRHITHDADMQFGVYATVCSAWPCKRGRPREDCRVIASNSARIVIGRCGRF